MKHTSVPLLCVVISMLRADDFITSISTNTTTYNNIPDDCEPITNINNKTHNVIINTMRTSNVSSVWLPIKKINHTKWTWLDGSLQGERLSSAEWTKTGRDCAVLRAQDHFLDDVRCNNTYSNFICHSSIPSSGAKKCTNCAQYGEKMYHIYTKKGSTWFQAKEYCFKKNQTLAVFPRDGLTDIIALLSPVVKTLSVMNAWIGLRLTEYYYFPHNNRRNLHQYFWSERGPCPCPDRQCVTLTELIRGEFKWVPAHCSENHHYICQISETNIQVSVMYSFETQGVTTTTLQHKEQRQGPRLGVIIALTLSLVAVAVLLTVFFFCYKKKRQKFTRDVVCAKEGRSESTDIEMKEKYHALEEETDEALLKEQKITQDDVPAKDGGSAPSGNTDIEIIEDHFDEPLLHQEISEEMWNIIAESVAKYLASSVKEETVEMFEKEFLIRGWGSKIVASLTDFKTYKWEKYLNEIKKWRGNKSAYTAWEELKAALCDTKYEMTEYAELLTAQVEEIRQIKGISTEMWGWFIDAFSRHLASIPEGSNGNVKKFLTEGLAQEGQIQLEKKKNWQTWAYYHALVEQWRGKKSTDLAWTALKYILRNSKYKLEEHAAFMKALTEIPTKPKILSEEAWEQITYTLSNHLQENEKVGKIFLCEVLLVDSRYKGSGKKIKSTQVSKQAVNYVEQINKWRDNRSPDKAWNDLKEILKNDKYEMADLTKALEELTTNFHQEEISSEVQQLKERYARKSIPTHSISTANDDKIKDTYSGQSKASTRITNTNQSGVASPEKSNETLQNAREKSSLPEQELDGHQPKNREAASEIENETEPKEFSKEEVIQGTSQHNKKQEDKKPSETKAEGDVAISVNIGKKNNKKEQGSSVDKQLNEVRNGAVTEITSDKANKEPQDSSNLFGSSGDPQFSRVGTL